MQFFPSLLFGVSASLDALLVGISYGIRQVHIKLRQNLFISLVTLLGTCLSIGAGHLLTALLPDLVSSYAGSVILMLLGAYYISKWLVSLLQKHRDKKPSDSDDIKAVSRKKEPQLLSPAEVFALSLTLSLNNLGIGLSASLAGLTLLPTAVTTLACSILFLFLGNKLGRCHLLQLAGYAADPVSGILLIGLGFTQIFW